MDLSDVMINFAKEISTPGWRLIFSMGGLFGYIYGISSTLQYFKATSTPGIQSQQGGGALAVKLIICGLLVQLAAVINATSHSFLEGEVTYGAISYVTASGYGRVKDIINALFTLVNLFGGFFCLKGMNMIRKATLEGHSAYSADDMVMRGFCHLIGGAAMVQIDKIMDATIVSMKLSF